MSRWLWLRLSISLAVCVVLYFQIDWGEVAGNLAEANIPLLIIPPLAAFPLMILFRAWKWRLLLRVLDIHMPLRTLYGVTLVGVFFNNFLPTSIGGDVARGAYVARASGQYPQTAATVLVDRASAIVPLAGLAGVGAALQFDLFGWQVLAGLGSLAAGVILLSGATLVAMRLRRLESEDQKEKDRFKVFWAMYKAVKTVGSAVSSYRSGKGAVGLAVVLSLCIHMLSVFSVFVIFRAMDLQVTLLEMVLVWSVASFVGLVPISINGWGVREGTYVVMLGQLGLDATEVLGAVLMGRMLLLVASLAGGILFAADFLGNSRQQQAEANLMERTITVDDSRT